MADVFYTRDATALLQGKKLYFIGDSNIRALYKDLICLLCHNRLLSAKQLREKAEKHFLGDDLLRGSALTKGRDYREDRRYKENNVHVEFHFVTKCLNEDIEYMMDDFRTNRVRAPDILVMNSTMWDVNRWGCNGVELFKDNMMRLMRLFKSSLPPSTLVIWVTAPPLSVEIRGGFMIKQIEYAKFTMRFHVMEANMFAQQLFSQNGYNVLDFHFHLRWQVHWRNLDGLHWSSKTMRHLCNLLLTHISLALKVPLPGNYHTAMLNRHKAMVRDPVDAPARAGAVELPTVPQGLLPTSSATAASTSTSTSRLPPPRPPPRPPRPHSRREPHPNRTWYADGRVGGGAGAGAGGGGGGGGGSSSGSSRSSDQRAATSLTWRQDVAAPAAAGARGSYHAPQRRQFQPQLPPPPSYPTPAYQHLPAGPYAGGWTQTQDADYAEDGPFFEPLSAQPQPIQSLWGPVRHRHHRDSRRQPY